MGALTSRLTEAGPLMSDCQPRRDPGVRCSRFVRRSAHSKKIVTKSDPATKKTKTAKEMRYARNHLLHMGSAATHAGVFTNNLFAHLLIAPALSASSDEKREIWGKPSICGRPSTRQSSRWRSYSVCNKRSNAILLQIMQSPLAISTAINAVVASNCMMW